MSETLSTERILQKAKALLNLQRHAATKGEAEAAALALAKLLERHRLTVAQVEAQGQASPEYVADEQNPLASFRKVPAWQRGLIDVLCRHYGVARWWDQDTQTTSVHLCGRQDDMELLRFMYSWLSMEIYRLSRSLCRGKGRSYQHSFRVGFVDGIEQQLAMAHQDSRSTDQQMAIMIENRFAEAAIKLDKLIDGLSKITHISDLVSDLEGYHNGWCEGSRKHLGPVIG